jgi:hypothetical protein
MRTRTAVAVGGVAAAVIVGAGLVFGVAGRREAGEDTVTGASGGAYAMAGTLPGGFEVAPGSVLLGPVLPARWVTVVGPDPSFAVVAVEGDPAEVWRAYVAQAAALDPAWGLDPHAAPGCRVADRRPDDPVCSLYRAGLELNLVSVPGDVTGKYLLTVTAVDEWPDIDDPDFEPPEAGDGGPLPAPSPPRPRPAPGEPLAPETVSYVPEDRYVLVEGSELVAQYSPGSLTGGFGLLLRVPDEGDLDAVAAAYVEQATEDDEPVDPPEVAEANGATVRRYDPPGAAGGYSGTVWSIDRPPGEDDWLYYELIND